MNRKTEILLFRWCASHHFILLFVSTLLLSMISGYAVSVGFQKLPDLFPYISDTGSKPPASCIFGMLLNLASVFAFVIIIIRHGHFERCNTIDSHRVHILNDVSFFIGFLTAMGAMMVSNFQESNVLSVHLIGAFMCFGAGMIYCWIHSYLSYLTMGTLTSKLKLYFRLGFSCVSTVGLILTTLGGTLANVKFVKRTSNHTMIEYDSSDPVKCFFSSENFLTGLR